MKIRYLVFLIAASLTASLAEQESNVEECPSSTPERGTPCERPNSSPACPYDHLLIPMSQDNGYCDLNQPAICSPMITCVCEQEKWQCLKTEIEFCAGRIPEGAFEDCTPPEKTFLEEDTGDTADANADESMPGNDEL